MKIIPVIDIKNGIAVAAKKGERDRYKPLDSVICKSSCPVKLAESYKNLGFSMIYAADLDGILYSKPDIEILKKISGIIPLATDTGARCREDVLLLKNLKNTKIVIGTETLPAIDFLQDLNESGNLNFNNFILSIDIKDEKLLNNLDLDLLEFIEKLEKELVKNKIKTRDIIAIDLSQVGTSKGPNLVLCKKLKEKLNNKKIIYGGGIRNISDIRKLKDAGIYGVLIGTALHSGKITVDDLKSQGFAGV